MTIARTHAHAMAIFIVQTLPLHPLSDLTRRSKIHGDQCAIVRAEYSWELRHSLVRNTVSADSSRGGKWDDGHKADRGLRASQRLTIRGARAPLRVDRLVLFSALRFRCMFRRLARRA